MNAYIRVDHCAALSSLTSRPTKEALDGLVLIGRTDPRGTHAGEELGAGRWIVRIVRNAFLWINRASSVERNKNRLRLASATGAGKQDEDQGAAPHQFSSDAKGRLFRFISTCELSRLTQWRWWFKWL